MWTGFSRGEKMDQCQTSGHGGRGWYAELEAIDWRWHWGLQGTGSCDSAYHEFLLWMLLGHVQQAHHIPHLHHCQHTSFARALHWMGLRIGVAKGVGRQEIRHGQSRAHYLAVPASVWKSQEIQHYGRHLLVDPRRCQEHHSSYCFYKCCHCR